MTIYHGSTVVVEQPQVITSEVGRDFGPAFYTTDASLRFIKFVRSHEVEVRP